MTIKITFKKGTKEWCVDAEVGETLHHLAHRTHVDLECACEGSLACSTCHCVFDKELYKIIGKHHEISDDENDMLDLAYGLTATSRLGCQVKVIEEMNGATLEIPEENRNSNPGSN
jgi:ferredoxin